MPNPLSDVERIALHTSDGLGLRAEVLGVDSAAGAPPRALAVVCHPHPLHGGTMHNHVISSLFTTFAAAGVPTIRFNFRGTSGSEGRHGGGLDERLDVIAAIEAITARHETGGEAALGERTATQPVPLLLAGYSFGAMVALSVDHPRVTGWFAVAPPLSMADTDPPVAATDPRPTVILAGTADDFSPASEIQRLTQRWAATRVVPLPEEDHFLATAAGTLTAEARTFVDAIAGQL